MEPIKEFPGYFITKCGEVFSERKFGRYSKGVGSIRQLKPYINTHGYLDIVFSIDGRRKHKPIHRLVAETFLEKTDVCVNHKDGNQLNNFVENLEWCSDTENKRHHFHVLKKNLGDNHWNTKITSEKFELVKKLRSQGVSYRKIAKEIGCCWQAIQRKMAGG